MTTTLTLESLGITSEQLIERVVARLAQSAMTTTTSDEDGDEVRIPSAMKRALDDYTREAIDKTVERLADQHLLPRVNQQIEEVVLQQTNTWGKPVAPGMSFVEYLVQRAEAFMVEPVDNDGKTQADGVYNWRKAGPRLSVMIDKYINITLTNAVAKALASTNTLIGKALAESVNTALAEVVGKVSVAVATPKR